MTDYMKLVPRAGADIDPLAKSIKYHRDAGIDAKKHASWALVSARCLSSLLFLRGSRKKKSFMGAVAISSVISIGKHSEFNTSKFF